MVETLTTLHNAHLWHGRANGVRRFLRSTHTDFAYNLHVRIAVAEHVSGFNLQITCRSIRLSHWLSLYYILFNGMWFVLAFQHQLAPSTEIIRVWVCFVRLNTFVILFHIHFHIPHTHTIGTEFMETHSVWVAGRTTEMKTKTLYLIQFRIK